MIRVLLSMALGAVLLPLVVVVSAALGAWGMACELLYPSDSDA